MMYLVLLLVAVSCVSAFDRQQLAKIPTVVHHFQEKRWLGTWYYQARLPPCSFAGSSEFTDMQQELSVDGNNLRSTDSWRSDSCVELSTKLTSLSPGCYRVKDNIGNAVSGEMKVVATDYKGYSVGWQCIKRSADGKKCDDPFVSVKTRQKFPTPRTWKMIEKELQDLWQMGLIELIRVTHDSPCKHSPSPMKRHFKTY